MADTTTPKRLARRTRTFVLAAIGLAVIASAGIWYWRSTLWESTDDAQIDGFIYPVSSRVSGHVTRVMVDDNQHVEAGTVLAQLDPKDYEVDAYGRTFRGRVLNIAAASGARFSLLPPENATGNYVKVVQRIPVKIVFDGGQDAEHLLRPGMSVEPNVSIR
jgi:multidrug resistance efflux pump